MNTAAKYGELDFNRTHPELEKGEIFLENIKKGKTEMKMGMAMRNSKNQEVGDIWPIFKRIKTGKWNDFEELCFKSKRLGNVAYNSVGKIIRGARPVFMKIWELKKEKGINLNYQFKDYLNPIFCIEYKETQEKFQEKLKEGVGSAFVDEDDVIF